MLAMAGVGSQNISSQDSRMIQELLSLKARLASNLSAARETSCSFDFAAFAHCAEHGSLHRKGMSKEVTEVVIDGGAAYIMCPNHRGGLYVPKPPFNKAKYGRTQHVSICETGHATQDSSSSCSEDDDIQALQALRKKLAIRLADTSHLQHSFMGDDSGHCSVLHLKL
mmetsp:Transcript_5575/g.10475  ORF Transcript_5575/g.10475 Transcript_5575/m.10475 type:complete len:168 (+) Transcript_5575:77-580(+)